MAVPHTLPSPDGGHGCPVMSWAMLKWLKQAGHDLSLFAFAATEGRREPGRVTAREQIKQLGVRLFEATDDQASLSRSQWRLRLLTTRKIISPQEHDYFAAAAAYGPQWQATIDRVQPDALWLYTTDAAALSYKIRPQLPRLASLVDLDHEAHELKRALRPVTLRNKLRNTAERLQDRLLTKAVTEILADCDVVIEHSVQSAEWLNRQGIKSYYLPNPVELPSITSEWIDQRERYLAESKNKRILMVGHLRGIATQTGLHLLADEILPALDKKPYLGTLEIHIVGGGDLTPELKSKLGSHPKVRLRGFVSDLASEYQQAHLSLVAVKEKIGFRTRLVEGFNYASASVVHSNNKYGMPELQHGYNSMLACTGQGLADAIEQVLGSNDLRRNLELNAKRTYESKLHLDIVMNRMFEMIQLSVKEPIVNNLSGSHYFDSNPPLIDEISS